MKGRRGSGRPSWSDLGPKVAPERGQDSPNYLEQIKVELVRSDCLSKLWKWTRIEQDLGVPHRAIRRLDQGRDGDARRDTQFPGKGRLAASATPIRFHNADTLEYASHQPQSATATCDADDTQRLLGTAREG